MPPQQICKVHSSIRTPSAARCRYYVFADGGRGWCHFVADGLIWPVPSALYFGGVVWQQYVQRELLVDPPIGRTRGRCPPWLLPLRRRCCWRIETGISDGGLSVERCRIPLKYVGTDTCYIRGVLYHTGGGGPKMFSRERSVDTHLTVEEGKEWGHEESDIC